MITLSSILLILLSVIESTNCENNDSNNDYQIPSISLSNLKTKEDKETLGKALSNTGIIAVTDIDEETQDFSKTRNNALEGLCECSNNKDILDIDNSESFTLSDGITTRTSIATLTSINSIPLSLNNNQIDSVCSSSSVSSTNNNLLSQSMEKLRDYVHLVSKEFILALDDIITGAKDGDGDDDDDVLLETSHGKRYNNVNDIIQDATHLEHFHVYSKKSKQHQNSMHNKGEMDNNVLDTHIDAGLFLSFVPSMSCNSDDVSSSFMVHVDGKLQTVKFPSNSIIIMLGIGAEHWLQNIRIGSTSAKLVATKHAVQMNYDSMRSWYGTMYLVPEKAIIDKDSKSTFEDMRSSMIIRHPKHISNNNNSNDNYNINEYISIGCGNSHSSNNKLSIASSSLQQSRSVVGRRLQTHVDASVCNNSTNFYCWMSCIDVPNTDSAHDGETLYCADATILDEGIDAAVTSCSDIKTGAPGGAMNTNCVGVWYTMEDDVSSQTLVNIDYSAVQSNEDGASSPAQFNEYCYGGTSMYMNGFQWEGLYCVIYLFPSWVLNTPWKLLIACFGTILGGIAVEGVITARRMILQSKKFKLQNANTKLFISMILYGAQLTLGYLIMLVVMTYSGPLFISVIIGLMIGHVLFQVIPTTTTKTSNTTKKDKNPDSSIVIEGATPCCQYRVGEEDDSSCGDDDSSCGKKQDDDIPLRTIYENNNDQETKGNFTHDTYGSMTEDNFNSCNCSTTSTPKEEDKQVKEYVFTTTDTSKENEQQPDSCCADTTNNEAIKEKDEVEIVITSDIESPPPITNQVVSSCCGG